MNVSTVSDLKRVCPPPTSLSTSKSFAEFFAGIGLVEEGLRKSGWRRIYANDVDARKRELHSDRNGKTDEYHLADVRNTEAIVSRITEAPFLATASFPCIDLSTAGLYRGFQGEHSSTFFAFIEVLRSLAERRPKLVMLENVVGFLTSREGADFSAAASSLAKLGYWLDAFVIDARHFVPQSRPRVFVIGMADDLRPLHGGAIDLFGRAGVEENAFRPLSIVRLIKSLHLETGWAVLDLPSPPRGTQRLEDVIDLDPDQQWWDSRQVDRHYAMMSDVHRGRIDRFLVSGSDFVGTVFRRVRKDGQRAEVRFDGLAGCLRTPRGGSGRQIVVAVSEGALRMRWMSPREYARLQGAPDFPLKRPTNQLLKGFADAVCVPAIEWIDKHVLTPFHESTPATSLNNRAGQPNP